MISWRYWVWIAVLYAILIYTQVESGKQVQQLQERMIHAEQTYNQMKRQNDELHIQLRKYRQQVESSRSAPLGRTVRMVKMDVSAYTNNDEGMNGKGITTSGTKTKQWRTVAAADNIPLGTRIYIPYFKDERNGGIFIAEDRGGAIEYGKLDIFMNDRSDAIEFGRRDLDVYILK